MEAFKPFSKGLTLAEVLISLALLGLVAMFTLPKLIQSSDSEKYNSITRETVAAISQAYNLVKLRQGISSNTTMSSIMDKLNTLGFTEGTPVNSFPGSSSASTCFSSDHSCYQLPSGAVVSFNDLKRFGRIDPPLALPNKPGMTFAIDPSGKLDAVMGICMVLFPNGQIIDCKSVSGSSGIYNCDYSSCEFDCGTDDCPRFSLSATYLQPGGVQNPSWFHY